MKYVYSKTLILSALLLGTLSGCLSTPEVSVSSLGKKLPAPALKGTSPFEQNIETIGYVQIQGTCDARIGTIYLSFDNKVWHQVPTQPNLTGTSLPANTVNDNDCSNDGAFNAYLTKTDLTNTWGIVTGDNGADVDYIYIKGSTLIGDTEVLTIVDTKDTDGGGSAAATILLEKTWPSGGAGVGKCGYFTVSLVDENLKVASHAERITFNISVTKSGSTSTFRGYNSWSECEADFSSTNNTDSFEVKAHQSSTQIVYRFPTSSVGDTLSFRITNQSALTAGPATNVVLKSTSGPSLWFALDGSPTKIYRDACYPIKVTSRKYSYDSYAHSTDQVALSSTDARVLFYSDDACENTQSTFTFATSTVLAYIKFVPSATDAQSFVPFAISAQGVAGNVNSYDPASFNFSADLTNKNTATKLAIWGASEIANGQCSEFKVVSMNDNGTALPVLATTSINLSTLETSVGTFKTDASCSATASSATIDGGKSEAAIYFKPYSPGTITLVADHNTMTSGSQSVVVKSVPTQLAVTVNNWTYYTCALVTVSLLDGAGLGITAPQNMTLNVDYLTGPTNYSYTSATNHVYPDSSSCVANSGNSNSISFSKDASTASFYIKNNTAGYLGKVTVSTINPLLNISSGTAESTFTGP
ncbi:MAG: hypothetical protein HUU57_02260 [Bdellovibrio sp.]|nr:hypothetical protein [Bdellovibrio sp.]